MAQTIISLLDNSSEDGFDVKPKALKMSPRKKFTALVTKDSDVSHDHYNLYGCTKQPALHGQHVGLKLRELLPDIDTYVDGYVGCMECEDSRKEVPKPISTAISRAEETIRSNEILRSEMLSWNSLISGTFPPGVCDKLRDILNNKISLDSPKPTYNAASIPLYTPTSPVYSPILPKTKKTSTVPEKTT